MLSCVSEYVDDDDDDADDAVDDCTVLDAAVSDAVVHWSCCMLSGDDGADDGDDDGAWAARQPGCHDTRKLCATLSTDTRA